MSEDKVNTSEQGTTRRGFLRTITGGISGAVAVTVASRIPGIGPEPSSAEAAEVVGPKAIINYPQEGETLPSLRAETRWTVPKPTSQMHIQMIPYNNDGPGVNLYWGDQARINEGVLTVPEPQVGQNGASGQFITLPGIGYKWRIRISEAPNKLDTEKDDGWGPWEERGFRTPTRDSRGISLVSPALASAVEKDKPQLRWNNKDTDVFYYEVQVSKDSKFETDPAKATAPVSWEFIHVSAQSPAGTYYQVKDQSVLERGQTYYWRVRPRIQGDGKPVSWSETWNFVTPPPEVPVDPKLEKLLAESELTDWVEKFWNGKGYRVEMRYAGSPFKVTIASEQKQALIDVVAKDGEKQGFRDVKLFVLADQSQAPDGVGFNAARNTGLLGNQRMNGTLFLYFVPFADLDLSDPERSRRTNETVAIWFTRNSITGSNDNPFENPLDREHGALIVNQALRVGYQGVK